MNFTVTDNHKLFVEFYRFANLEVSPDPKTEDGAFFTVYKEDAFGIAVAATLSFRGGAFILDYIAVRNDLRGSGLGKNALCLIMEKAKSLGAKELYITAKNTNFFKKMGFVDGEPKGIDLNLDCRDCPQFLTECFPKNMKYDLQDFEGEL